MNINKREENKVKEWMIKSDKELKNKIDELRRARYIAGLDNNLTPYNEILKAAFRFTPLIDILKKAKLKKDDE